VPSDPPATAAPLSLPEVTPDDEPDAPLHIPLTFPFLLSYGGREGITWRMTAAAGVHRPW
jgi:hypothetical protein